MKVLFLDFDGVLNSAAFLAAEPGRFDRLDPAAVARLNAIVGASGAKVVISSSWRVKRSLDELRALLAGLGFVGEVIDRTPELRGPSYEPACPFAARASEIRAWLGARPEPPSSYVILDDAILEGEGERHVRTDFTRGLLDEHVAQAIDVLREPSEGPSKGPSNDP